MDNIAGFQEIVVNVVSYSSIGEQTRQERTKEHPSAYSIFVIILTLLYVLVSLIRFRDSVPEWLFWLLAIGPSILLTYQIVAYRRILWTASREQARRPLIIATTGFGVAIIIGVLVINNFGSSQASDVKQAATSLISAASFLAAASVAMISFFAGKFLDLLPEQASLNQASVNRESALDSISELNAYGSVSLVLFVASAFFAVITVLSGLVAHLGIAFSLITLGVFFLVVGWQKAQSGIRQLVR